MHPNYLRFRHGAEGRVTLPVNLLQLSDIHLTADGADVSGFDPAGRLRQVLDAVARTDAELDALLLTGDLTDDGSRAACGDLASMLAPFDLPALAIPGNHDDPAAVRDTFGSTVLELAGWRIVGIDTSRLDQIHGTIDVRAELDRLDSLDQRWTLLAMHHPPVSPSTNAWFKLDGGEEFVAALATRRHVRAIVTGHLHDPFELTPLLQPIIGCPSSLIAFRHDGDDVQIGGSPATGARLYSLGDDGSVHSRLVVA